jgi:peroxiredoxin
MMARTSPNATADSLSALLQPGTPAPDFSLESAPGTTMELSSLRGRSVILVFYPADWSPICGDELALYNELMDEFRRQDAELLGISVDSVWCHKAFREARHLAFSHCWRTSSRRDASRACMARIARAMARRSARCS